MRRTESRREMLREAQRSRRDGGWLLATGAIEHPRTRGECAGGPRPCPLVGCRYHLYLDVADNGSIKATRPGAPVWEMEHTCALDVAEQGGMTLEEVAELLGVTRERVRQLEERAMLRLAQLIGEDPEAPDTEPQASFARNHGLNSDDVLHDVLHALGLNKVNKEEDSCLTNLLLSHLSTNHENELWLTSMTDSV